MAEISVTALAPRIASTRLVTTPPMASSASLTRTLVTIGKASATDLTIAASPRRVPRSDLGQGRDMGVRRALEGVGREHQHEIDAEALPVDGAHIGDGGRDVAAEHVDDDLVADLEPEPVGDLLFDRDQRRTVIVGPPPFALDHLRALGDFAAYR